MQDNKNVQIIPRKVWRNQTVIGNRQSKKGRKCKNNVQQDSNHGKKHRMRRTKMLEKEIYPQLKYEKWQKQNYTVYKENAKQIQNLGRQELVHKRESVVCTLCSSIAIIHHNCERSIHAQSHKTKLHEVESNRNRIVNNLIPNKTCLTYIYIWQYDTRDNTSFTIIDTRERNRDLLLYIKFISEIKLDTEIPRWRINSWWWP